MKKTVYRQLLITIIPAIMILLVVVMMKFISQRPIAQWTSDISTFAKVGPFTGFVSTLGIMLWGVTTAILLFSAFLLHNLTSKSTLIFLFISALASGYLFIDDLFLFHEVVIPCHLGIREDVVFIFIGLGALTYFVFFIRKILSTDNYSPFYNCCGLTWLLNDFGHSSP